MGYQTEFEGVLKFEKPAQGESIDDCWKLVMQDGKAIEVKTPTSGTKVTCPECDHEFYYTEK